MNNKNSLYIKYPNIANEWDFEKNGNLTPENVTYGSHLDVYWICPICHQSYKKKICNRTAPSKQQTINNKCPVCLGRVIIPGFNSLKAKFPEIVSREWDFEKNKVDPDTIPPHQNKPKYWWKCDKGHSYEASINNKTSQNGGNCPYCSHQKLSIENSLAKCNPNLAKEWYSYKNKLSPEDVFVNSNQYAWWKCYKGHVWKAKINNRNNGRGCPECSKWRQTSFPEQIIFYYTKQIFPDTINSYKLENKEIDIYIPSLKLGIEYDGEYYHKGEKRLKNDLTKNEFCFNHGISLIRVRESNCAFMNDKRCTIFNYEYSFNYKGLEDIVRDVFSYIGNKFNIVIKSIDINISDIKNKILNELAVIPIDNSLASRNVPLSKDWDYQKNYPLTPENVMPNSSQKAFWKCHICNYEWEAVIGSRNIGSGCPRCSKRERYTTESWIHKANKIHHDKYDYSLSKYTNAKTKIDIICPIHGNFSQLPSEHLSGKGCPYCVNQEFHPLNSFANLYPEIAKEWDYELNNKTGFTPENIGINSSEKFYWHCNYGKSHSYLSTISYRVSRKSGCAICHGKQINYENSVAALRPDLVEEWSDKNILKPEEVTIGSEKTILWKCNNKDHKEYYASVYSRVHLGSGCPECAGNKKSHKVYEKEIAQKFPAIKLLSKYEKSNIRIKCQCKICGHIWTPFPYNLLKGKGCPICRKTKINS